MSEDDISAPTLSQCPPNLLHFFGLGQNDIWDSVLILWYIKCAKV